MSRFPHATVLLGLLLLSATGCAHYQLGTGRPSAFRSVFVEPVSNRTLAPQIQAILSTRLRESFLRDARLRPVNSAAAADTTLTIAITEYRRDIAAVRADDTGLARKFNVSLTVTGTLRDIRTGKAIWENRPFTATREAFTDGGQLQSEYEVVPLLAEQVAARILHATLDTW